MTRRQILSRCGSAIGCLFLAAPSAIALQEKPQGVPVKIGSVSCFLVRRPDGPWSPEQRVARIHNIFAKHLGRSHANFSTRRRADRVDLFLNGDFLIGVTAEDARATGQPDAATLAKIWLGQLQKAFQETHVWAAEP